MMVCLLASAVVEEIAVESGLELTSPVDDDVPVSIFLL
jgi:hypothetical protein